jgi:hypothetical protein
LLLFLEVRPHHGEVLNNPLHHHDYPILESFHHETSLHREAKPPPLVFWGFLCFL